MKNIYIKLLYLFFVCLFFFVYFIKTSELNEELELDNNIIAWNNELLTYKKNDLLHKTKIIKYYNEIFTNYPSSQKMVYILSNLKKIGNNLNDFSINISKEQYKESNCIKEICLIHDNIEINFTYINTKQALSFLEEIQETNSIIIQHIDIINTNKEKKLVKLLLKNYYKQYI